MKKVLGSLVLFGILATGGMVYAQQEIDACWNFNKAGDYKRAIEAGKLAVKKYPDNLEAYACLGTSYYNLGKLKLAYKNLKKAESLASDKEDLIYIYGLLGLILNRMSYLNDALSYYNRSLRLAKDSGNTDLQATLLNNIAGIYGDKGESDKALNYYEESLSLKTNGKDKATTYNNIATIYDKKGDYQKAVEYLQKAIEIDEKYKDYFSVSFYKLNLGETYRKLKDYKNAEKYLTEGLEGVKRAGDEYSEAKGYRYFGYLYEDKGDKEAAREYYTRAYNLYKSIGAEGLAQDVLNEMKKLDKSK